VELAEHVRAAPPLSELAADQRAELERELALADCIEDLPGKWQAALLEAEGATPRSGGCCHGTA
jgi:hypothetical protein